VVVYKLSEYLRGHFKAPRVASPSDSGTETEAILLALPLEDKKLKEDIVRAITRAESIIREQRLQPREDVPSQSMIAKPNPVLLAEEEEDIKAEIPSSAIVSTRRVTSLFDGMTISPERSVVAMVRGQ
jgi:hypothetical protein